MVGVSHVLFHFPSPVYILYELYYFAGKAPGVLEETACYYTKVLSKILSATIWQLTAMEEWLSTVLTFYFDLRRPT